MVQKIKLSFILCKLKLSLKIHLDIKINYDLAEKHSKKLKLH